MTSFPIPPHDGHGAPSLWRTIWHDLVEPAHLPVTLLLAVAAVALVIAWRLSAARSSSSRSSNRRP